MHAHISLHTVSKIIYLTRATNYYFTRNVVYYWHVIRALSDVQLQNYSARTLQSAFWFLVG